MKKTLRTLIAVTAAMLLALPAAKAQDTQASAAEGRYFPYPIVPDSITNFQKRCDYLITHFWDFCDMKKAFSSRQRMAGAFREYLDLMPHASARTVHRALSQLLRGLEKQPDDQLFLAREAEAYIHSDTSEVYSDELYIPFAVAVASNKRIDSSLRKQYERQATLLSATQVGMTAPEIAFTDRNGRQLKLDVDTTLAATVIFFNEPDCFDCIMAKGRLNADITASQLIDAGQLRIIAITPADPDDKWKEYAATLPEKWIVGATPDADEVYDLTRTPGFYVLDPTNKILIKNIDINTLLQIFANL